MRVPFGFIAEYRGLVPSRSWTNRSTGELVEVGEKLKFEVDLPDGDTEVVQVRGDQVAQVADFDVSKLVKGDSVGLQGVIETSEYDGTTRVRVRVLSASRMAVEVSKA